MKFRWIMRLSLIALLVYLAYKGWLSVENNPGLLLIYCIFVGAAGGFLFVKGILPWMIEALTTSLYSSGEKINPEEASAAEVSPESTTDKPGKDEP